MAVPHKFAKFLSLGRLNYGKAFYSSKTPDIIPKNVLKVKGLITGDMQADNGAVYDKKPFKIRLEAGKNYFWCLCGRSKSQPMCDGTHKFKELRIKQRPIKFQVEETKDYWLCNCKHTGNRPFCDGTHKTKEIEDATSILRQ